MTDSTVARATSRLATPRSRRQVLRAVGTGTAAGLSAVLVARPLGMIGNPLTASAQGSAAVSIVDFAFDPGSVAVDAGGTVTWTNQGPSAHTVTADDGSFDSGTLDVGGTFSFTFTSAGTFSYHCSIHPNMVGSVAVSGGETPTETPPATVMPATGSGPSASDAAPWLGVALAGGVAALLAGRGFRKATPAPEE